MLSKGGRSYNVVIELDDVVQSCSLFKVLGANPRRLVVLAFVLLGFTST